MGVCCRTTGDIKQCDDADQTEQPIDLNVFVWHEAFRLGTLRDVQRRQQNRYVVPVFVLVANVHQFNPNWYPHLLRVSQSDKERADLLNAKVFKSKPQRLSL